MRKIEFTAPTDQTITIFLVKRYTDNPVNIGVATEFQNTKTTYHIDISDNIQPGTYRLVGLRPNGRVLLNLWVEIGMLGIFTAYDLALSDIQDDISDVIVKTIKNELRNTTIMVSPETKVLGPCKDKDYFDINKVNR
jgi:hypothetical protein